MSQQSIILDTCIIQFAYKGNWKTQTEQLLNELEETGFIIAVSSITLFETLRSANPNVRAAASVVLNKLSQYVVNDKVLEFASDLYGFYRTHQKIKQIADKISSEDVIIASTAAITGSLLLTSNMSDFPSPFFTESRMWRAEKGKGRNKKALYFCLLKLNEQAVNDAKENKLVS